MIVPTLMFIGVFVFFGWLILNSAEAKRGNHKKNKKTLIWIMGASLVLFLVVMPAIENEQSDLSQEVRLELLGKYEGEISEAEFLKQMGDTNIGLIGQKAGITRGRYLYKIKDLKGNHWDWIVYWEKTDDQISIVDAREY